MKELLGTYEFSTVPRSSFALDGTQLLCVNKSSLIKILEDQVTVEVVEDLADAVQLDIAFSVIVNTSKNLNVVVLGGMAEQQSMKKSSGNTCSDFANEFNRKLEYILSRYYETHVVFDTYRENSLKSLMRKKKNW